MIDITVNFGYKDKWDRDKQQKTTTSKLGPTCWGHSSRATSMVYTNALKRSGNLNFNPIDLKIDMHANGAIRRNLYY